MKMEPTASREVRACAAKAGSNASRRARSRATSGETSAPVEAGGLGGVDFLGPRSSRQRQYRPKHHARALSLHWVPPVRAVKSLGSLQARRTT